MAFQISITDVNSEIIREYNPGIVLKGSYEVGLKHFVFWNSMYNVTSENNILILVDQTSSELDPTTNAIHHPTYTVSTEPGYYKLDDIIQAFHELEVVKKSKTTISVTKRTLKVRIKSHWEVHFTSPNSIGKVLGFSSTRVIKPNTMEYSDLSTNIFSINTVKIHCNLISSNIEDVKRNSSILYDFPLDNSKIGGKVVKESNPISYFNVNTEVIYKLVIKVTDQDNNLINFLGEQVNLTLHFRPQ